MANLITSIGSVKTSRQTPSGRQLVNVDFGRTVQGFPVLDTMFMPIGINIPVGTFTFQFAINVAGDPMLNRVGEPVLDDTGNPRVYQSDSLFCWSVYSEQGVRITGDNTEEVLTDTPE